MSHKNSKKIYPAVAAVLALFPLVAGAQSNTDFSVTGIFGNINQLISLLVILIFAVAGLIFLYGIMLYIYKAGDAAAQKEAGKYILFGILGLVIMFGFYALVRGIGTFFNITPGAAVPTLPRLPGSPPPPSGSAGGGG